MIKSKIFTLIIALAMTVSITACNQTDSGEKETTGTNQEVTTKNETETTKGLEESINEKKFSTLQNPNIKLVTYTTKEQYEQDKVKFPGKYNEIYDTAIEFETKYGGKVDIIVVPWEKMTEKIITMQGSGEAPDVMYLHSQNYPFVAAKGIVQPIESYIDINDPIWWKVVNTAFMWKGKTYGVGSGFGAEIITYNKTMFEDNGLKTPLEYYKDGEWNFDTFGKVGKELTQDLDQDGKIDQWGFATWGQWPALFMAANGGRFLKVTEDGVSSGLKDPLTIESFSYMQDWVKQPGGFIFTGGADGSFLELFKNGKIAMCIGSPYPNPDMKDEIEAVILPFGPSNKDKTRVGGVAAYGIPTGAANPDGGAAFTYLCTKVGGPKNKEYSQSIYSQEYLDMVSDPDAGCFISMDFSLNNIWGILPKLMDDMKNGIPPATIAETNDPVVKASIDKTFGE